MVCRGFVPSHSTTTTKPRDGACPWRFLHMVACFYTPKLLSLCFILSLVYCFLFYVVNLGCDVSTFSYASLTKLKMYYRGDIVVKSLSKPYCTSCNQTLSISYFINTIFSRTGRNTISYPSLSAIFGF